MSDCVKQEIQLKHSKVDFPFGEWFPSPTSGAVNKICDSEFGYNSVKSDLANLLSLLYYFIEKFCIYILSWGSGIYLFVEKKNVYLTSNPS